MGRQKLECPRGKYRLRTPKSVDTEKLYPLQIEYNWHGSSMRKNAGISVRVADWNPKGNSGVGELRPSFGSEYKRENALLAKKIAKLDADLREYNEKHPKQVTIKVIDSVLHGKPLTRKDEGKDFVDFALERLESKFSSGKIGYSRYVNGCSGMSIFQEFLKSTSKGTYKDDSIYLGDVTPQLIEEYKKWRKDIKGNCDETVNHALAPIISACEFASDFGYIERNVYAYVKNLRIAKARSRKIASDEDTFDGKYLSKEQMKQVIEFYKSDTEERRKEFLEMFLFAFHACGLRVVDVMTLQWKHIDFERKEIRKVQVKTKNRECIPLTDEAIAILKSWKEKHRREKYVFDLVKDSLDISNEEELYNARINATKCINQALKVVGIKLKLPFSLTMHKARHTFACWALNDGVSISVVSRLLGHQSTDITERVYAQFYMESLSDEVAKLDFSSYNCF